MQKVYIICLEQLDSRYTAQWYNFLPTQLENAGLNVEVINGDQTSTTTTKGAFLDFAATNIFKSSQLIKIAKLFQTGKIKDNDYFLYTDAWNPTVLQLRYIAELLGIKIKIGGLWHAGSYDSADFLGRLIGDVPWVRNTEAAMFHCYDHNFFATRFHINMFARELLGVDVISKKDEAEELMDYYPGVKHVGWPMEYLKDVLAPYANTEKKNKIIFPHRIAPEKQLEIFKDLAEAMPEYEWFVAQEHELTKDEYHRHLAESKLAFSANLQETLGISMYEAALVGTCPVIPGRLSYTEMWDQDIFYPSEWTTDFEQFLSHKDQLIGHIKFMMGDNVDTVAWAKKDAVKVGEKFFNGTKLYNIIKETQK